MKSLNRVQLIGRVTKDFELRKTANGFSVCNFIVATNRSWTTESGEKKTEAEFHKIIAWNNLADLCYKLLQKSSLVYVEGKLATRKYKDETGNEQTVTEIVLSDVIVLDAHYEPRQDTN